MTIGASSAKNEGFRRTWMSFAPAMWVFAVTIVFLPLSVAALWMASAILDGFNLIDRNREWVIGSHAALWSVMMVIAVLAIGWKLDLLGDRRLTRAALFPFLLAIVVAFVIATMERITAGQGTFESDDIWRELLVPMGLIAVGTAQVGLALAGATAVPAWRWALAGAWFILLAVALQLVMLLIASRMFLPEATLALAVAVVYGLASALMPLASRRHRHSPGSS